MDEIYKEATEKPSEDTKRQQGGLCVVFIHMKAALCCVNTKMRDQYTVGLLENMLRWYKPLSLPLIRS